MDQNIENDNVKRAQQMEKIRSLAETLDTLMDEWEVLNNIDASHYEDLSKEHFRAKLR